MNIQIETPYTPGLCYGSELPEHYNGPVVKNGIIDSILSDTVEMIMQQVQYPGFEVRYISGRKLKKLFVDGWQTRAGLCSSFMLKNGIRKSITHLGKAHLRKDHHLLSYIHYADCMGVLDNDATFEVLEVTYTPELLQQVCSYFPKLEMIITANQNSWLGERATYWTPPQVREVCLQLLHCPYDAAMQHLYFDMKVRELLFFVLHYSLTERKHSFTVHEVAKIYEARQILENTLDKKVPTIRELSRAVALNEFKLKKGFRQLFHSSIFDWALHQKMLNAKEMLEDTRKPMKEIAQLAGYQKVTNFIIAYKKHFGITPGAVRRS
ncbi:helix-turn-helix transcriptional regulator [Niabella sp. 22666]|uniref:helix-turn-helix transcriptional regulator n=1 Tax=Niabella sp. 22666 TaxID=3453954 RepID=UPI003F8743D7